MAKDKATNFISDIAESNAFKSFKCKAKYWETQFHMEQMESKETEQLQSH